MSTGLPWRCLGPSRRPSRRGLRSRRPRRAGGNGRRCHRSEVPGRMDHVAAEHREHGLEPLDLTLGDGEVVRREHGQVRELAGRERALPGLLAREPGAADGPKPQRLHAVETIRRPRRARSRRRFSRSRASRATRTGCSSRPASRRSRRPPARPPRASAGRAVRSPPLRHRSARRSIRPGRPCGAGWRCRRRAARTRSMLRGVIVSAWSRNQRSPASGTSRFTLSKTVERALDRLVVGRVQPERPAAPREVASRPPSGPAPCRPAFRVAARGSPRSPQPSRRAFPPRRSAGRCRRPVPACAISDQRAKSSSSCLGPLREQVVGDAHGELPCGGPAPR